MTKKVIAQRLWQSWDDNYDQQLGADSTIIELPQGQVEYCTLGEGDPVVITHNTPGGYDQARLFAKPFLEAGFKVICWSRPGYLNTPLSTAKIFAEQTELSATLLDYLWIDNACHYGIASGAAISIMLAKKYPEKVESLILENPVSAESLTADKLTQNNSLDSVFFMSQDNWLLNLFQQHFPQVPHKLSIKGENYFDEAQLLSLLQQKFDDNKSKKLIQLLKTTGPTEKKEQGFYNDVYEISRFNFDITGLIVPYLIIAGEKDGFNVRFIFDEKHTVSFSDHGYQLFLDPQYKLIQARSVQFIRSISWSEVK